MFNNLIILLLFLIIGAFPAYAAKGYSVISINGPEANIQGNETKKIFRVKAGESLEDGWKVIKIDKNGVIIEKWLSMEECVRGILPARNAFSIEEDSGRMSEGPNPNRK